MGGSTRLEILPDGLASASLLLSPGVRQHTLSPLQGQPVVGIFFFFMQPSHLSLQCFHPRLNGTAFSDLPHKAPLILVIRVLLIN